MKTVIKIGSASDNGIIKKAEDVSQHHALLKISDKEVIIEDLDSTNGTFVNGIRIKQAILGPKDRVVLANKYDISELIPFKKIFPESIPNDYTQEFASLKQVYDDYVSEKENIIRKSNLKTGWLKFFCVSVPVIGIAFLHEPLGKYYFPIYIGVNSVLSSLALFVIKDKGKETKLKEVEIKFKKNYKCPRPKCEYRLHENWEIHRDQGKCPHCKAIWAKPMEIDF